MVIAVGLHINNVTTIMAEVYLTKVVSEDGTQTRYNFSHGH